MPADPLNNRDLTSELTFSASRSSGPGGQNVNKVSTRVELRFHVRNSRLLTDEEKLTLSEKLAGKINSEGELVLVSQTERTQLKNKGKVLERFYILIRKALTPRKKRKPTKPSEESVEKRLEEKRRQGERKRSRRVGE